MTTAYHTPEQQAQQDALDAIRYDMHMAQLQHMRDHNMAKRGFIGRGTRGIPSYATTTNHNER